MTRRRTLRQPGRQGHGRRRPKTVTTTYSYFANLAVGLCEGPIALRAPRLGRRRASSISTTLDHARPSRRRDQSRRSADRRQGGRANAPAYRGLAYVVFERLPLADFGNRVPQFSFEVIRPVDGLEPHDARGVPDPGRERVRLRRRRRHAGARPRHDAAREPPSVRSAPADVDGLARCAAGAVPEPEARVAGGELVRRRSARRPVPRSSRGVDVRRKSTDGATWSVAGLTRDDAQARVAGRRRARPMAARPSDESVMRLIQDLKARGLEGGALSLRDDGRAGRQRAAGSLTGGAGQPAYPWRGRITCDPAPGRRRLAGRHRGRGDAGRGVLRAAAPAGASAA